jgi:ammonia channel protein AmtB
MQNFKKIRSAVDALLLGPRQTDRHGLHRNTIKLGALYFQLLWHRIVGASVMILWGSVWSCAMFGLLKWCGKLRVTEEQELKGERLDL